MAGRVRGGRGNGSSGKPRSPRYKTIALQRTDANHSSAPIALDGGRVAVDNQHTLNPGTPKKTKGCGAPGVPRECYSSIPCSSPDTAASASSTMTSVTARSSEAKPEVHRLSSSVLSFWGGTAPPSTTPSPKNTTTSTVESSGGSGVEQRERSGNSVRKLASRFEQPQRQQKSFVYHDSSSSRSSSSTSSSGSSTSTNTEDVDDDEENTSGPEEVSHHYQERLVARRRLFSQHPSEDRSLDTSAASSSSTFNTSGVLETSTGDSSYSSRTNTTGCSTSSSITEGGTQNSELSSSIGSTSHRILRKHHPAGRRRGSTPNLGKGATFHTPPMSHRTSPLSAATATTEDSSSEAPADATTVVFATPQRHSSPMLLPFDTSGSSRAAPHRVRVNVLDPESSFPGQELVAASPSVRVDSSVRIVAECEEQEMVESSDMEGVQIIAECEEENGAAAKVSESVERKSVPNSTECADADECNETISELQSSNVVSSMSTLTQESQQLQATKAPLLVDPESSFPGQELVMANTTLAASETITSASIVEYEEEEQEPYESTLCQDDDDEEVQTHDANKSDYSEGILYNLIHAAQAAVEQQDAPRITEQVPRLDGSSSRSLTPSVINESVVGESSTMTRGGETVWRSNRSNRVTGSPPLEASTTSSVNQEREITVPKRTFSGVPLIDVVDEERTIRERYSAEYISESSVSGTESATSGDNSDLEAFLDTFVPDFVGNQEGPLARMRCTSANQVVETEKKAMPSLLEIREYLKKDSKMGEEVINASSSEVYSKAVLGNQLSETTSQVDSHPDTATWNTELTELQSDVKQVEIETNWFDLIQNTLLSITNSNEPQREAAADPQVSPPQSTPNPSSPYAKSFDTLDEIIQALQGTPPRSAVARATDTAKISAPNKRSFSTPSIDAGCPVGQSNARPSTFSSTPIAPPIPRGPAGVTEGPNKVPSVSSTRSENSMMDRTADSSILPPVSDPMLPTNQSFSGTSVQARKQIDEVYSLLNSNRADWTEGANISKVPVQSSKRHIDTAATNVEEPASSTPTIVAKRRTPKISITTGSLSQPRPPANLLSAARGLHRVPQDQDETQPNGIEREHGSTNKALPTSVEHECNGDTRLPRSFKQKYSETNDPDHARKDDASASVKNQEGENSSIHIHRKDISMTAETNLTHLGQEWLLETENNETETCSSAGPNQNYNEHQDEPHTSCLPDQPVDDLSEAARFEGYVRTEESVDLGDISMIKPVNSSITSDPQHPASPPRVEQMLSAESDQEEYQQRSSSPSKVLKRLGSMIFTRGGRNISESSQSATPHSEFSGESITSDPSYAALGSESECNGKMNSSGDLPVDRKPTKQVGRRWLRRSPVAIEENVLLEHEDAETKVNVDTPSFAPEQNRNQDSAHDHTQNRKSPRSLIQFRQQQHLEQDEPEFDTSWAEFSRGDFEQQETLTMTPAIAEESLSWVAFPAKPMQQQDKGTRWNSSTGRVKTQPGSNGGWEDFSSSSPFLSGSKFEI